MVEKEVVEVVVVVVVVVVESESKNRLLFVARGRGIM